MKRPRTYAGAGVRLQVADRWVRELRQRIRATRRPGVRGTLDGFGGLFQLPMPQRGGMLLVASADGAGTKVQLAQLAGRHTGIGTDVVAMNVNDLLTFGAEPLFFLDYLAMGRLDRRIMQPLMRGMVHGCRVSGCALLGGETAEMPGAYRRGEYDVAGFAVGLVPQRRLVDGRAVRAGDVIMGLASSGVHANGFSLVRRVFSRAQLRHQRALLHRLLTPTRIYVRPVRAILRQARIKAMAHITGGGLTHRVPSVTCHARRKVQARVLPGQWPVPTIFAEIQRAGDLTRQEMCRTFNMGVGFALVCGPADVRIVQRTCARFSLDAWRIGDIL